MEASLGGYYVICGYFNFFFIFVFDLVLTFIKGLLLVISYLIYLIFIIKSEKRIEMNKKTKNLSQIERG